MAPEDKNDDRRRFQRAPIDLIVSLKFASVQQFLSAHAGDISEGGMFIRLDGAEQGVGQVVSLSFDAGKERIVQGTARVVRIEPGGVALEFLELDEMSRRLVEMIVRIKLAAG